MKNTETIHFMVGADKNYALPLAVTVHSALTRLDKSRSVCVTIIDGGLGEECLAWILPGLQGLHPKAEIRVAPMQMSSFDGFDIGHYSAATYLRLISPDFVPDDIERMLFLDSDVLVTDDLAKLWDFPLGEYPFWAVEDFSPNLYEIELRSKFPEFNLPPDRLYCNAGILLFNMPQWKKLKMRQQTMDLLKDYSFKFSFVDQDALNTAACGNWGRLDVNWNIQVSNRGIIPKLKTYRDTVQERDAIRHFRGICHFTAVRPWHATFPGRLGPSWIKVAIKFNWAPTGKRLVWAANLLVRQFWARNRLRVKYRLGI
jgi:lipopolysaccharide biosynthesis glycosyltransferase